MSGLTLEQRIDRLESRAAINDLCTQYCLVVDQRNLQALADICTADVEFSSPDGGMNAKGTAAMLDMFNGILKVRGPGYHWTHDRVVFFDDSNPDVATGKVMAHAETTPNGVPSMAALHYDDVYRRDGGVWKFAKRALTFFYYVPITEYLDRFPKTDRVKAPDGWRAADFPESLDSWKQWFADNG